MAPEGWRRELVGESLAPGGDVAREGRGAGASQALTPPSSPHWQSFLGGEVPWASSIFYVTQPGWRGRSGHPQVSRGVPGSPTQS